MGKPAQQSIAAYLRRRLHVVALPIPSVGLISGQEAVARSAPLRAHFTLMSRFEMLSILPAPAGNYGMLTLTGRIHVVLLRDGRPEIDRTFPLPATYFTQTDPPANIAGRVALSAMESIYVELAGKLSPR
jgi:hypothetical protein